MRTTILMFMIGLVGCGGISREAVQHSQREYDLAVGLYADESNVPGAFEHLLEALELDPENPEAHLLLGKLLLIHRSDFEGAERHLREAIRTNEISEIRAALPADALTTLGNLYINAERYADAVEVLSEASSDLMNRQPELTYSNLARAYLGLHRSDEALQAGLQSVQHSPNSCVSLYWLSEVRVGREEDDEAHAVLDRLLGLESCHGLQQARRLRGEIRARRGDRQGAVTDFERCIELGPATEDGAACQAYLESGPPPEPSELPAESEPDPDLEAEVAQPPSE